MARTKWLDGLRGVAAFIVAFDHLFMSDVWHPFISFWSDPPEENRHLVQLPPIRILFSAHAMVTLFMVISGYAISVSLLKDQSSPQFIERVSSAVVRRGFRIYLPVLVTATLAQILYFFNLYSWGFDEEFLARLPKPWTNPWGHFVYLCGFMADSVNIIAFDYPGSLNSQLWTMPLEFRGSNVIYLLIVGLSAWKVNSRLYVLPALAAFFLWAGNWDIFGFIWGLWLAQRAATWSRGTRRLGTDLEMDEIDDLFPPSPPDLGFQTEKTTWYRRSIYLESGRWDISHLGAFVACVTGFHLLCLGHDGHLPPGYQFLTLLQPARWKNSWDIYHWCWKSVGAALLVYSISVSPLLQGPLNTRAVQYLGKISFALYLLHETIYQLFRNRLRDLMYKLLSGREYGSTYEAVTGSPVAFHLSWWVTGGILGAVAVCTAHYYTICVDNKCVAWAKRVDKWLSS